MNDGPERTLPWRPLVALGVIAIAVVLVLFTPVGKHLGPDALDRYGDTPAAAAVLVALYLVTFGLGIPGSALFLAAGFVFSPAIATALGVFGGTSGSVIAHGIGSVLGAEARERWRRRRGFAVVERSLDFSGILTLRLLPAFPHSVLNYGCGIAGARLAAFIPATALGLAVKAFIYASVAHEATRTRAAVQLFRIEVFGPLIALALITLAARRIARRRARRPAATVPAAPPAARGPVGSAGEGVSSSPA